MQNENKLGHNKPPKFKELPVEISSLKNNQGRITLKKRRKLLGSWPVRAGFIKGGNNLQRSGDQDLTKGTLIEYQILGSGDLDENLYGGIGYQQNINSVRLTMDPHGLEDVNAATKTIRETTDAAITEDEQYMAGTALISCYDIREPNMWPGEPWDGTEIRCRRR